MARGRLVAGLVLAAGSIAGALYLRQQRLNARAERVGLYFADGTLLELGAADPAASALLALAGELVAAYQEPS